jgi:hypothetical protein
MALRRSATTGLPVFVDAADGAATLLSVANVNMDWAHMPAGRWTELPVGAKTLYLALIGNHATDPDAGTIASAVFLYFEGGPAQAVCSIAWTIGKQQVLRMPYPPDQGVGSTTAKWADSAVVTSEKWIASATVINHAADGVCMVKIPSGGAKRILIEFGAPSSGLSVLPVMVYNNE